MPKPVLNLWKKASPIYKRRVAGWLPFIMLLAGSLFSCHLLQAQNPDIDILRSVNPDHPKSVIFRGLSSKEYPISIAIPAGTFLYGQTKHNKQLKVNVYEGLGSLIISAVAVTGLKTIIPEDRPYVAHPLDVHPYEFETSHSFPSGHAAIAFATATTLSLQYKKWYIVVPAYAWAASCSYSRLYLGMHYPSDVLAGAAIGTGSAIVSHWLTKKIFKPCSHSNELM